MPPVARRTRPMVTRTHGQGAGAPAAPGLPDPDEPGPVAQLLVGPAGSGRSAALDGLRELAHARGRRVLSVALAPAERAISGMFLARLVAEAMGHAPADSKGLRPSAASDPSALALVVCRMLRQLDGDPVVLVDDAQWIDPCSASLLPVLLRGLVGSRVRGAATIRTPARDDLEPFGPTRLASVRRDRLVVVRALPRLARTELGDVVRDTLQASPDPQLRRALWRASLGLPAALLAALDGYRAAGAIRVLNGQAYLVDAAVTLRVPADHPLLAPVRTAPDPVWAVATAMAALSPVGPGAVAIAADVLELAPSTADRAVQALVDLGVLRGAGVAGWRFVTPLVAAGLRGSLGPYRARQLARRAVETVWTAPEVPTDPDYLCEQIVLAGPDLDADRAARELLNGALRLPMSDSRALRWLAVASQRASPDDGGRAEALFGLAAAALRIADFDLARHSAESILDDIDPGSGWLRGEATELWLRAMHGLGETAELERWEQQATQPTERATALSLLGRWSEAARVGGTLAVWAVVGPVRSVPTGRLAGADLLRRERVARDVGVLALAGDVHGAQNLLAAHEIDEADLPWAERALLAWRRGAWSEALDHAGRASLIRSVDPACDAMVVRAVAEVRLARGRPLRARADLAAAGEFGALSHLRDLAAADIEAALGDAQGAVATLTAAAISATRHGVTIGTDEIWLRLTGFARERGDAVATRHAASQTARAARGIATAAGRLSGLLAMAAVGGDVTAARDAVAFARELDQPRLLAGTLERAVSWGAVAPTLLTEAYELLGALGATLDRARVRATMRRLGVSVPGRASTAAESERLLTDMVADGLSSQQLAAALRTTPKSVESRLTRVFARSGYPSRAALAADHVGRAGPRADRRDPGLRAARG